MEYLKNNHGTGTKVLFCPFKLFHSLKMMSKMKSDEIYKNSHKCVFIINQSTNLIEIEIVPNSYSYRLVRNLQNTSIYTHVNPQTIDRLQLEMNLFTEALQSMFYLKIVKTNHDIGIVMRGLKALAKTLDIKKSKKKDYIYQCLSKIISILENINF